MTQQTTIPTSHKFYRSIHYKSASLDIKPHNKINVNIDKLPVFQLNQPINTKKNLRTNNKINFFQSTSTHLPKSLSHSLSKIHPSELNTTLQTSPNPQLSKTHHFDTCNYIQSFQQLMQAQQKNTSYKRKKLGSLSIKLDSLKNVSKINDRIDSFKNSVDQLNNSAKLDALKNSLNIDRIALPNIIQYENSQFTALDPIRLPINSVKEDIQRTKKSMEQCPINLRSIRCEMKQFHDQQTKQINEYESQFKQGVKKLWQRLRQNSVYHQGFIMRMRRQIKSLQSFIPQFTNEFQSTKASQIQVQKVIFQTAPFELKRNIEQSNHYDGTQKQQFELEQEYF